MQEIWKQQDGQNMKIEKTFHWDNCTLHSIFGIWQSASFEFGVMWLLTKNKLHKGDMAERIFFPKTIRKLQESYEKK